jgi:hypothetical protein
MKKVTPLRRPASDCSPGRGGAAVLAIVTETVIRFGRRVLNNRIMYAATGAAWFPLRVLRRPMIW